jgi:hypothetical protein
MKYLPLFTLQLTHSYYADGRCPDLEVEPAPETQRLLRNHRCLVRQLPDGAQVFVATVGGEAVIPLSPGMTFTFELRLRNPEFALFTDVAPGATPVFANPRVSAGAPVALTPAPGKGAAAGGAFATAVIAYGGKAPAVGGNPGVYRVAFEAKQLRWVYYLVADGAGFAIADRARNGAALQFGGGADLARPDPEDAVAVALAAQYPAMRRLRFVSEQPVPCRQNPRRSIQLLQDGDAVIETLPNPSLRNFAALGGAAGGPCLYHVVRYFTRPNASPGG